MLEYRVISLENPIMATAVVKLFGSQLKFTVPVQWLQGINMKQLDRVPWYSEWKCFISNDLTAKPNFNAQLATEYHRKKARVYNVHVLTVNEESK